MAIDNRDKNIIDQHLRHELLGEDKVYFESRLNDLEFTEYLREQEAIVEIIKIKGREHTKDQLRTIEASIRKKEKPVMFIGSRLKLLVAASFAILVSALIWFNLNQSSPDDLFTQYYTPYPNLIDPLTKSSGDDALSAFQLYELQEYDQVIEKLKHTNSTDAQWYRAQSFLAKGSYSTSLKLLIDIKQDNTSAYQDEAEWYEALIYVKLNKEAEAKLIIEQITMTKEHNYYKKATELLSQLN